MFAATITLLLFGFPVALTLGGTAVLFALLGSSMDAFSITLLGGLPSRFVGIMLNGVLVAVPLFVFMGVTLERSRIADQLLTTMALLFGRVRGGLGFSVIVVGMLLAASTGIAGAAVVTMGLLSLPTMLKAGYNPRLACGVVCASGTLGQIVPPSIALVLLADLLQGANTQAQLAVGNYAPEPVSVVDLFAGAFVPGVLLVFLYLGWQSWVALTQPDSAPALMRSDADRVTWVQLVTVLLPPLLLILAVLGSILAGVATATESAAVGAVGAMVLAVVRRQLDRDRLREIMISTTKITSMVFMILLGASVFALVFRGFGGDQIVGRFLSDLPGGAYGALFVVMVLIFVLGFFLDFVEIIFIVVPIAGPILLGMGIDPIWLGVLIAINVQCSFLTPPFGFSLFYLRGVAPPSIVTADIYRGIVPFVILQLVALTIVAMFPPLATWLPTMIVG
jgi:tripartite ATP-independent transporter DctM subunit